MFSLLRDSGSEKADPEGGCQLSRPMRRNLQRDLELDTQDMQLKESNLKTLNKFFSNG